jgi:hypothetical protein
MSDVAMSQGYPAVAVIETALAARGIEMIPENNMEDLYSDLKRFYWAMLNAFDWASALGVWPASSTTFNVRAGKYHYKGEVKTYTPSTAINPTDNDTTYVWLEPDNTVGSAVDGTGWPTTEHVKLAEIDVDSGGVITAVRDLRGQTLWNFIDGIEGTAWQDSLQAYGASKTTFNVRGGKYLYKGDIKTYTPGAAVNPTDNDTTYIWLKPDNTIDSAVDGTGWPATEHVKLAEIDVNSSGVITAVRDLRGQTFMDYSHGFEPIVLKATLTAGNTVALYTANTPYKMRILDAHSVARSADGGTWKVTDGTNDIIPAVTVTGTDKTINRAAAIDDAYYEIAAGGSLSVVGDGSLADVEVTITAVRVW